MNLEGTGLKVIGQTNFTQPSVWYDADRPEDAPHGFDVKNAAMSILKPVVQIQDGFGNVLYSTGEFYEPQGKAWLLGAGLVMLLGVFVLASKIAGSGRN